MFFLCGENVKANRATRRLVRDVTDVKMLRSGIRFLTMVIEGGELRLWFLIRSVMALMELTTSHPPEKGMDGRTDVLQ